MKKVGHIALTAIVTMVATFMLFAGPHVAKAIFEDTSWLNRQGLNYDYLETAWFEGREILINGLNHYVNFGFTVGETGYGFRDNDGVIEAKSDGGSWGPIQTGSTTPNNITLSENALIVGNSSSEGSELAAGSAYQLLHINASGVPAWTSDIGASANRIGTIYADFVRTTWLEVSQSEFDGAFKIGTSTLATSANLEFENQNGDGSLTFGLNQEFNLSNLLNLNGGYVATNGTTTNATSTNLAITGLSSALLQVNANGNVQEYAGTSCTNQFPRSISALGIATCASVSLTADVSGALPILNGGTNANTQTTNGVNFFNGTSITSGSALTFNGNTLGISVNGSANALDITQAGSGTSLNINNSGSGDFFVVNTNDFIIKSTGRVGVNDSTPDFQQEIVGSSGSGYFGITNSVDGDILTVNSSGLFGIASTTPWGYLSVEGQGTNPAFVVSDSTNNTDFIITATGNVGIGTTTPQSTLSSVGDLLVWDGSTNPALFADASTGKIGIGTRTAAEVNNELVITNGGSNFATVSLRNQVTGTAAGQGVDFYAGSENFNIYNWDEDGGALIYVSNGDLAFNAQADGDVELAGGNLHVKGTGNVGIGETSPGSKLSVSGNATIGASYDTTAAPTNGLLVQGQVAIATTTVSNGADFTIRSGSSLNTNRTLSIFNSSNEERLTITDNGRIGMGTTSPQARLHIVRQDFETNAIRVSDNVGRPTFGVTSDGTVNVREYGLVKKSALFNIFGSALIESFSPTLSFYDQSGGGDFGWQFQNEGGQLRFNVDTDGDDVYETRGLTLQSGVRAGFRDETPDYALETVGSNTNGYFGVTNSTDGDVFAINASADIGIGTSSPTVRLAVQDTIDGNIFQLYDTDGNCLYNPESGGVTVSCSSDARLKTNIQAPDSALEWIKDIKIQQFEVLASGDIRVGVIAQEIQKTHPELVHDGTDGYLKVELPNPWRLVQAIQELMKTDSEVLRRLEALENRVVELESELKVARTITSINACLLAK